MSVLRFQNTLASGASVTNLLSGTIIERLTSRREVVSVYAVIDTETAAAGLFVLEFRLGNVVVADGAAVAAVPDDSSGPDRDKHLLARALGDPFDLVQVRLFNGDANTTAYRVLVETTPA